MKMQILKDAIGNEIDNEDVCPNCNGEGYLGRPCIVCGKVKEVKETDGAVASSIRYDTGLIPKDYQSVDWSLEEAMKLNTREIEFEEFAKELNSILDTMKTKGEIPNSYIIVAPSLIGKRTWAYTFMKVALDKGLRVAPIIDTLEFNRLSVLSAERPKYKLNQKISYDDYITADVVILTVTKDHNCTEAFAPIMTILDKRSRLGLATIVTSNMDINVLSKRDFTKSFQSIIDLGKRQPNNKYPYLVRYRR